MITDLRNVNPDRIQFLYSWIRHGEQIGELTFFNSGRFPGSFAVGNELFHWNQACEHSFAGGFVVKSPGLVTKQIVPVQLQGSSVDRAWDHTRELARDHYGDRPIIQVISPPGQVTLLSYRPTSFDCRSWRRVIPALLDTPKPYGMLSRRLVRVVQIYIALAANCAGLLLVALTVLGVALVSRR